MTERRAVVETLRYGISVNRARPIKFDFDGVDCCRVRR